MNNSLFDAIQQYVKPGMTVLDVGAFDLSESKKFAAAGCHVIALDKKFPSSADPIGNISLTEATFEEYVPDRHIDILFMSYVAPFIERKILFEKIKNIYKDCSVIAIRAFTKMPEPSFPKNISLYSEEDSSLLPGNFPHESPPHEQIRIQTYRDR